MYFKTFLSIILFTLLFSPAKTLVAQDSTQSKAKSTSIQHGQHFIDEDGDGYNDNAPDHDNDGIPNGLDPDWQKEGGKSGNKKRWRYIDLDGDGINDNLQEEQKSETPDYHQNKQMQQKGSSIEGQQKMGDGKQKKKKGPNK